MAKKKYEHVGTARVYREKKDDNGWMGAVAVGVVLLILIGIFA